MSKYYVMMPTGYVEKLQQDGKRDKARAFLEYFLDMHNDSVNSFRFYQQSWGLKSSSTPVVWIKEFKEEISKFFAFWELKNSSHYSAVSKTIEQKSNTLKDTIEHKKDNETTINTNTLKDESNTLKDTIEHESNEDTKSNNINNINADSNESADENSSSKKNSYSANFEILWNRYDKKTSNKGRSQSIYLRKWKNTDIKIMIEAIDKYKATIDLTYLKDFDGFLNGVIDTYIPRRAWIVDKNGNKHLGWFYDNENRFISDELKPLNIKSNDIADYIDSKRFGYVA